uniref:Rho guanine nucleotide exchange factor 38 n=1 Tax=Loxodonta africana TaxID=9785 RepID=G3UC96_LOXAF
MMIKPIQRVMKYPLLLCELRNSTPPSHPDYRALEDAFAAVRDINVNINELKRRKDLVLKYKKSDEDGSLKDKLSKLSIHSISKKSKRMTNHLKILTRGESQQANNLEERMKGRFQFWAGSCLTEAKSDFTIRFANLFLKSLWKPQRRKDVILIFFSSFFYCALSGSLQFNSLFMFNAAHLQRLVLAPLSALLSLFPGPQKLIQKRYDKLLDYNSYLQRSAGDESDLAKKEYEALNAQLVEELQVFNQAARKILFNCLYSFITLLRDLMLVAQRAYSTVVPVLHFHCSKIRTVKLYKQSHTHSDHQPPHILHRSEVILIYPPSTTVPPLLRGREFYKQYLLTQYSAEALYQAKRKCNATQEYDINLLEGELVAVMEQKDPLGSTSRWLVDTGIVKGYVYSSFLKPYNPDSPPEKIPRRQYYMVTKLSWLPEDHGPQPSAPVTQSLKIFYAVHAFQARSDHELSLQEYQRVHILRFCDLSGNKEWWLAEAQGQKGYVPANYLGK